MSSSMPMRLGMPLKYQIWLTGAASSMWPMRSRRTLARVTSTPHLSQTDALVAHALVAAAVALPVLGGPEDALAEQAVALGLEGAVVDGFGLFHLAVATTRGSSRGRQTDLHGIKIRQVKQNAASPFLVCAGGSRFSPRPRRIALIERRRSRPNRRASSVDASSARRRLPSKSSSKVVLVELVFDVAPRPAAGSSPCSRGGASSRPGC